MSRESESNRSLTPAIARWPWGFDALLAFSSFASTRRGKWTLGASAAALLLAGSVSTASYMGADIADEAQKAAQSVVEMMKQRSPGARTGDILTKTKSRKYAVLSSAIEGPSAPKSAAAPPAVLGPMEAPGAPVTELAQLAPVDAPPVIAAMYLPPWAGGGGPPSQCCSGGGGPPGPPGPPGGPGGPSWPPVPPGPTPGVPEPATWAMMLLGFAASGWSIRRQRARAHRASACA